MEPVFSSVVLATVEMTTVSGTFNAMGPMYGPIMPVMKNMGTKLMMTASVAMGIIGTFVVVKRIVFISGGISHTAYGGVGLGYLAGFDPIFGAIGFSVLAALASYEDGRVRREHLALRLGRGIPDLEAQQESAKFVVKLEEDVARLRSAHKELGEQFEEVDARRREAAQADGLAEIQETARSLGNGHAEQGFRFFAHGRAFGDVPQPVAVQYAWDKRAPWANLFNKDGLPALIFRAGE